MLRVDTYLGTYEHIQQLQTKVAVRISRTKYLMGKKKTFDHI